MKKENKTSLYQRIRHILESARSTVARSVNTAQVVANWLIGREIVEEEQNGKSRADYGKKLIATLATRLQEEYGNGYSPLNLWFFRRFFIEYSELISLEFLYSVRKQLVQKPGKKASEPLRNKPPAISDVALADVIKGQIIYAVRKESWKTGQLHPNLSWTHYRMLLGVDSSGARSFYEIEAIKNNWSARELERQINSLLYERLSKSRDKGGLIKLATKGHQIQKPTDVFKDPIVIEFLGLPESPRLVESRVEEAIINNLQAFLLELGKGFAFVSRQERLTLDGDHFYIDLVFYHTILKCYVLVDVKRGKLTHGDLGQIQFYVNYFNRERRTAGDNPTLGLILCTDKNDAVVKYTLGPDQERNIFASRYKLHLPSEGELQREICREVRELRGDGSR